MLCITPHDCEQAQQHGQVNPQIAHVQIIEHIVSVQVNPHAQATQGQATPPAGTFTQVSAGGWHTCGLRTNGYWTCWGYNGEGQLNGYRVTLPLAPRDN